MISDILGTIFIFWIILALCLLLSWVVVTGISKIINHWKGTTNENVDDST